MFSKIHSNYIFNISRRNTGYFYVEYTTHGAAAVARRKLVPDQVFVCGMLLNKVDWAEPEPEVDEEELARVMGIFSVNCRL